MKVEMFYSGVLFAIVLSGYWLKRGWDRVEVELDAEKPSGARAFLSLFKATILFMVVLLLGVIFISPYLGNHWSESWMAKPNGNFGDLVNQYASGLNLVFAIPTALAGSVVAILLALRALRSADEIRRLTETQTHLMQEQNALQKKQMELEQSQVFFEAKQAVLDDLHELHRLYFELCNSILDYFMVVRRDVFLFWEFGSSGIVSHRGSSLIEEDQVVQISAAQDRLWAALKDIAGSPVASQLWSMLAQQLPDSLMEALREEMIHHSLDNALDDHLSNISALIHQGTLFSPFKSSVVLNKTFHECVIDGAVLEQIWRSSFYMKDVSSMLLQATQIEVALNSKLPSSEEFRLKRLLNSSWECFGGSMVGSYILDRCGNEISLLSPESQTEVFKLIARELSYMPTCLEDAQRHLDGICGRLSLLYSLKGLSGTDWLDEIHDGATSALGALEPSGRSRAYFMGAGALLSNFKGNDFHNLGSAFLADIVGMLPNKATLVTCFKEIQGIEMEHVVDRLVKSGSISLDIKSFLPSDFHETAAWLRNHPVLSITRGMTFGVDDRFDKLFSRERFHQISQADDRISLFREMGLNLGRYQS